MVNTGTLPEFAGLRVLIVEDDLLIAMEMEEFLRGVGCEIVGPIGRLDQAMAAATAENFHGAVVDLNLRGELSFPLIEKLRKNSIPVVCCSGYVDLPEMKSKLTDVPTLSKPWTAACLLGLIRRHFAQALRQLPGAENRNSQTNPLSG